MKCQKKAQIFSTDVVIAIVTFIIILIASIWVQESTKEKIDFTEKRNDLELISKMALSSLVETPGNPSNWTDIEDFNNTNVFSLGLTRSHSHNNLDLERREKSAGLTVNNYLVLDETKIQRLEELNATEYTTFKTVLGILGPNYEFQLQANKWDGDSYETTYQIGEAPASTATNIVRADRFTLLNNTWTNIVFKVWQNCNDVIC